MQIHLPQADGSTRVHALQARPIGPADRPARFNRSVYAAAHVVIDPLASADPWDASPTLDWDATLAFREHLYGLGFRVAEAMDTAQRGMGVDWPVARELIRRSVRHARSVGGELACGVGTDQLAPGPQVGLAQVEAAYREQLDVVQAEGGQVILMASRALAQAARGADDYHALYGRILQDCAQPVVLHWLGPMFDPALAGYWGSADLATALDTVARLIADHAAKVEGIKVSLLEARWELELRRRLPPGVKMYTGDDFNYAELIAGDGAGHSHGLLGIFDPIAPVAAAALAELAAGRTQEFRRLLDPTVALSREIFRAPTRHYKAGVVFLAWLNGHQKHFSMAAGLQSARGVVHYARVFALADACGALSNPDLATARMRQFLSVHCGMDG
ncbi:dihydrodipicolinate synthase family protein [Verminephrobacter aporrectodeae]|uniref:Dihydrodipicolinate synthase family protein n=1 Tax=Verminephrobacter aporrectodeae subsp. tuberculatae TaxID=1110392 RepID=A0ABT3KPF4_9BURK|nr:dihydrodipicolinate synthase family protein [Verminephrobacter aporrectodeae]MCW5220901.1 dihydrodipicolinate synthase family protein [Verminephrobacter aporrectodeae subsp. tuberculatae]MCW5290196.1 dihydrodipicolinate synthase family protein [Verminephrobacter aporrectodeae subsp. tuberculatae]MCW5320155.1 dihydrodipicolinate synthase family protein [Verminephrobacter aporrectodeae subsp. tuberculatae]MCW8174527.1 dihydrodipicolinate synthase family protein [Verminephrobacter aporrectodeae